MGTTITAKIAVVTTQSALANGPSKSKTLLIVTIATALGATDKTNITFRTRPVKFRPARASSPMSKNATAGVKTKFYRSKRKIQVHIVFEPGQFYPQANRKKRQTRSNVNEDINNMKFRYKIGEFGISQVQGYSRYHCWNRETTRVQYMIELKLGLGTTYAEFVDFQQGEKNKINRRYPKYQVQVCQAEAVGAE